MSSHALGDTRARAWTAHLRGGGSTPWASFGEVETEIADDADAPARSSSGPGHPVPGATQLELVRRLNLAADDPRTVAHRALVERVLAASPTGRGPIEQPLVGGPEPRFGTRPVDPGMLPARELVRVAVGVLAEGVVAAGPASGGPAPGPVPPAPGPAGRLRGLFRGYALAGDPLLVRDTDRVLRTAGRSPGSTPRTAVVLGDDLRRMLADVWTWRVLHGATAPWPRWIERHARRDLLPRPVDLAALAAEWGQRLGPRRVHVVLGRDAEAVGEAARVLGLRHLPAYDEVPRLSRAALELLCRTNLVLRLMVDNDQHRALLRTVVVPMLADQTGRPPAVPAHLAEWLARREREQRTALDLGGYALHGDPAPPDPTGSAGAAQDDVLGVALTALLRTRTEVA